MHANRLMPNVYRKKLLAFTIICFTASFFIFCIIFSVFELKHKVALIKSFATSVRPVLGLFSLADLLRTRTFTMARMYFFLKCNYFTTSLLIQTQLIS